MHVKRISIDTNILVYAMDRDAGKRHVRAVKVVEQAVDSDCILTTQALGGFSWRVAHSDGGKGVELRRTQRLLWVMPKDPAYAEARALLKLLLISGAITLASAAIIVVLWWLYAGGAHG
ncbi:hypothetical protein [Acidithiobacillus sp. AMEEHan]|uniref:hypothetical protein n=1 Tax=Acidithiobacillus sp. AMEEHan TaxID=2994951 RepID=UPI0027E482EE|nr:hypothetical protein [Acidithiobacillus sp. AMEEHan]